MFDCTPTYLYKVIYSNCMLSLIVTLHKDCSEICGPTLQTLPASGIYMCWLRTLAAADTCQCGYSSNTEARLTMCRPVGPAQWMLGANGFKGDPERKLCQWLKTNKEGSKFMIVNIFEVRDNWYFFQASIAMSLCDNNPDSEVMNLSQKYQCTVFYGNALYHLQEYHKAEVSYTSVSCSVGKINIYTYVL